MALCINQVLPLDVVVHVLSFCNAQAARAAHTTCKIWMGIIDQKKLLYRAWCLEACPQATALNNSWEDRYAAIRHYSTEHCEQYAFDLGTFFERGFEMCQESLSFFQDEVLLTNEDGSRVFRCNYLTSQFQLLDYNVQNAVVQIYCSGPKAALVESFPNQVTIYDLTKNKTDKIFHLGEIPGRIKFYDGNYLIVKLAGNSFNFFDCKTGSQRSLNIAGTRPPSLFELFYDGKTCVHKDFSNRHEWLPSPLHVVDLQGEHYAYSLPSQALRFIGTYRIINSHLFAYITNKYLGVVHALLQLNSFHPKPQSSEASFLFPESYDSSALWATQKIFIAGLARNNTYTLAFWHYTDSVVLLTSCHKIQHLFVERGRILTSEDGKSFILLDFAGMQLDIPALKTRYTVLKSTPAPTNFTDQNEVLYKLFSHEKFCYENGHYFLLAYHISLKILKLAIAIFLLYSSWRVSKNLISKISY
jgi:hypothetical protein